MARIARTLLNRLGGMLIVLAIVVTVVFVIVRVTPGDPAQATPEQRIQMRQQIADAAGYGEAMSLVKDLRKKMKITVAESQL